MCKLNNFKNNDFEIASTNFFPPQVLGVKIVLFLHFNFWIMTKFDSFSSCFHVVLFFVLPSFCE